MSSIYNAPDMWDPRNIDPIKKVENLREKTLNVALGLPVDIAFFEKAVSLEKNMFFAFSTFSSQNR